MRRFLFACLCLGCFSSCSTEPTLRFEITLSEEAALEIAALSLETPVIIYTTFQRADGHMVEMHLNSGAHQRPFRAPGNAFSDVELVEIGPGGHRLSLTLNQVIPPNRPLLEGETLQQGNYEDAEFISVISNYVTRNAPPGADIKSWKY